MQKIMAGAENRDGYGPGQGQLLDQLQILTRDLVSVALASLRDADKVTLPQMRLLLAVRDVGAASGLELAQAVGTSPASVSRHAEKLVQHGLLVRAPDPSSRRIVRFTLTPAGESAVNQVMQARARALARLVDRVDEQSAVRLARDLRALTSADE